MNLKNTNTLNCILRTFSSWSCAQNYINQTVFMFTKRFLRFILNYPGRER